jgi:cold shock CspA family protein
MAEITPMYDSETCDTIRASLKAGSPHLRRSAIATFVQYLIQEDTNFCLIPKHETYQDQERIRSALLQQITSLSAVASVSSSTRYHRLFGKVTTWKRDKGFGFVKQANGEADAFLHIREVLNAKDDFIPEGATVEFEAVPGTQGLRAVAAVILE